MLFTIISWSIGAYLAVNFLGNVGISLYAIPYYILEFAKECWNYDSKFMKAIALICFIIGWPLHYLARIIWYGFFFALVTGISFLVTVSIIGGCTKG